MLTVVENKIPDVSSFVKKTDYGTKISDVEKKTADHNHDKYINNKIHLITKTDFDAKLQSLSKRITSNKTKHLLVENELKN